MRKIMGMILPLVLIGCTHQPPSTDTRPSALTPGMAKKHIVVGQTSQSEVLEIFGPPDLVTKSGQGEMWGYDKVSREVAYSTFNLGAGVLGGGLPGGALVGGIVGGGVGGGQVQQSTTTMFLLIYFNSANVVIDYKLSATKF